MTSPPPEAPESSRQVNAWTYAAIFLAMLFLVPGFLLLHAAAEPSRRAAIAARHGFVQLDNEEGALLFQAVQIARGESIYRPLDQPPWFAGTYTPLYMAAVTSANSLYSYPTGFTTGRYIVWVAALTTGILLLLIVLMTTRNPALAVLAGFMFLATWEVHRWIGYFRVDFLALALSLGGLAILSLTPRRWWTMALAALFMAAALYTKQTMIAAPAAGIIALTLHRRRHGLQFIGWMLLWGLPPLAALQVTTGGQFLRHIIVYNMNTSSAFNLQVWARHIQFMHHWVVLAVALALPTVLLLLVRQTLHDWKAPALDIDQPDDSSPPPVLFHFWKPVLWWALLAQWNLPAIAKAGSAENYLLEPIAGWAVIVTLAAGACLRTLASVSFSRFRAPALFTVIGILITLTMHGRTVSHPQQYATRFSMAKHPSRPDFEAAETLTSLMRQAQNPYSELPLFHLMSGHAPIFQPFIMSELARQGRWDQAAFVSNIQDGRYDLVITTEDVTSNLVSQNYTREMLAAFHQAYDVENVLPSPQWTFYVLRPKDPGATPKTDNIVMQPGVYSPPSSS